MAANPLVGLGQLDSGFGRNDELSLGAKVPGLCPLIQRCNKPGAASGERQFEQTPARPGDASYR